MNRRRLALPDATVHAWARRARGVNPQPKAADRELAQLRTDVPIVLQRMAIHGYPSAVQPDAASSLSRLQLTRLQTELRDATQISARIAQDDFLQQFRKHLHLLLDH